jgi:hypothetical protein
MYESNAIEKAAASGRYCDRPSKPATLATIEVLFLSTSLCVMKDLVK